MDKFFDVKYINSIRNMYQYRETPNEVVKESIAEVAGTMSHTIFRTPIRVDPRQLP